MIRTITEAADALRKGESSPQQLLDQCLANVERYESRVHAFTLVDRDRARAEADRAANELKLGYDRGLLHGVPLAIKDIIDVFDWPTGCGSALWQNACARQDAPVVRALRQAGAVLIGKTVTTAYASFDPPPTVNPHDLSRTPGGSSSGSAAAVACGMCFGALATQTGGSITRPAAFCGVPSCKPTYGTASVEGVLPLAQSMDHIGSIASCVRDVALLMQTIAGPAAPRDMVPGSTGKLPVLGRPRGIFERLAADDVRDSLDRACGKLREAGAMIRDIALPAAFSEVLARHRVVMAVESAMFHQERFARRPEDYGPCIRQLIEEGLRTEATEYARTKEHQRSLKEEMAHTLATVDGLICPATTRTAPDVSTTGDPAFNSPWSYTGLPVVSIPVGRGEDGLPLSVQLVGRHAGESVLFQVSAWCERLIGVTFGVPAGVR